MVCVKSAAEVGSADEALRLLGHHGAPLGPPLPWRPCGAEGRGLGPGGPAHLRLGRPRRLAQSHPQAGARADRTELGARPGDRRRRDRAELAEDRRVGAREPGGRRRARELAGYSGHDGSPVVAPRITLRLSSAHLRRVGEMSMPSCSMAQSASSLLTSSTRIPISSSELIDAAAWEIAQPWPWKRSSDTLPSSTTTCTPSSSPQSGLWSWNSRSCGSSSPKFRGFL